MSSTEDKEPPKIIIRKLYTMSLDCQFCNEYAEMQGGPVDDEKAKFLCSKCDNLNTIKWVFDF